MRATGVVRRIEECVIIGKPPENRTNTRTFTGLPH